MHDKRMKRGPTIVCLLLLVCRCLLTSGVEANANDHQESRIWKEVFQHLFVKNIKKYPSPANTSLNYEQKLKKFVYFNPQSAFRIHQRILEADTSIEANLLREKVLSHPSWREYLRNWSWKNLSEAKDPLQLRETIEALKRNGEGEEENYFSTPIGQKILHVLKDHVLIIISGYGHHTITDYVASPVVEEINLYYQRPQTRPVAKVGDRTILQDAIEFYSNPGQQRIDFDILHPLGLELGNSLGASQENVEKLHDWITSLPPEYQNKKIFFLGYSKGAVVALEALKKFPPLRRRTRGVISLAGTVQGSIGIGIVLEELKKLSLEQKGDSWEKLVIGAEQWIGLWDQLKFPLQWVRKNWPWIMEIPFLKSMANAIGLELPALFQWPSYSLLISLSEMANLILGMQDLTVYERIRWNLENLNRKNFDHPLVFFNLTALTDIRDMLLPRPVPALGEIRPPELIPQWIYKDHVLQVDWKKFSLDQLVLFLTSLKGFSHASAGLYDTQVAYLDSKSPFLDQRPIAASLSEREWQRLKKEAFWQHYNLTDEKMRSWPRSQLIPDKWSPMIRSIDLGEVRGNHWTLALQQVLRPTFSQKKSTDKHHLHDFPHKALYTALLELLALYVAKGEVR